MTNNKIELQDFTNIVATPVVDGTVYMNAQIRKEQWDLLNARLTILDVKLNRILEILENRQQKAPSNNEGA